uniref:Uncharacterized protein n=2 Tax=gambiae species complex TaxID=44542 RepID=A0A1S4H1J3_ANOGA
MVWVWRWVWWFVTQNVIKWKSFHSLARVRFPCYAKTYE